MAEADLRGIEFMVVGVVVVGSPVEVAPVLLLVVVTGTLVVVFDGAVVVTGVAVEVVEPVGTEHSR